MCKCGGNECQLVMVCQALFITAFTISWDAATFGMLLPRVIDTFQTSVPGGLGLAAFSIPFIAAAIMITCMAVASWTQICKCSRDAPSLSASRRRGSRARSAPRPAASPSSRGGGGSAAGGVAGGGGGELGQPLLPGEVP